MSLRVRVCVPVLVVVLFAPQSRGVDNPPAPAAAGSESALAGGVRQFERELAEHVLLRSRINVLHPNPQSVLDGLQAGFVNVSSGNLTFARRDIVVPGRRRVVFARIHDSRIRANADFGPGWRLSLDEAIIVDDRGAEYVDGAGARYRFRRRSEADYVPDPMMPRLFGSVLTVSGTSAVLVSTDGDTRTFERRAQGSRFALRRIEWQGGDWIGLVHSDAGLDTVYDADGEVLRTGACA